MGLLDSFGVSFDVSKIVGALWFYVGLFFIVLIIGLIVGGLFVFMRRKKQTKELNKIGWWEEVNGRLIPTRMDEVEEIVIPGTLLRIFYNRKKDLYIPRFAKAIDKGLYYVALTPTKQMVNFTLPGISEDLKRAKLDYDHTDMLWASENIREFVKRNYKDKAQKWWVAYQQVITTAIYILVLTFSFVIIIYFMRGIIQDISKVADNLAQAVANSKSSGIVPAIIGLKWYKEKH